MTRSRAHPAHTEADGGGDTLSYQPSTGGDTVIDGDSPAKPAPASTTSSSFRTTVLPRLSLVGSEPHLVQERRARFEPRRVLGVGGVGQVIAAWDHDIDRLVALKHLRAQVRSPAALARFVEEIRTVGRLEHPNIVPIHDVGIDERGHYYFVMKHVDGVTLEHIITRLNDGDVAAHRLYSFERRVEIFMGICEAIAYAHDRGFIHRDIKPANIMIGAFGEVLVMDWGIAKSFHEDHTAVDSALLESADDEGLADAQDTARSGPNRQVFQTQVGSIIGTPAYMSPEQANADPVDQRSDVYSLNVLLFELLTLHHPLAGKKTLHETLAAIHMETAPLAGSVKSPHQPPVSMDLSWLLWKGLKKDPAQRYQTVQEMLDRLRARAEGKIPIQCHITATKRLQNELMRFMDHHPILVTSVMALSILGAAAVGVWQVARAIGP